MVSGKRIIDNFFFVLSWFGLPLFYVPAVLYLGLTYPGGMDLLFPLKLLGFILAMEIFCGLIKLAYPKPRPVPLKNNTLWQKYHAGSFPSIHSARIMAVSVWISSFYGTPVAALLITLLVAGVGYSRIYLKKHYFTDVLAGYAIGVAIGAIGQVVSTGVTLKGI